MKDTKRVVFYAGEIDYFSYNHLPYAIPALLVLTCIVIPFPLLLLFDPFLLKLEGFLVQHRLLKTVLPWTCFRNKFKPLFDSFQGCFRDDARCFAGMFFIYRAAIYVTFITVQNVNYLYMYLELVLILMLTIQATVQPFQDKWHNALCCGAFFILLFINTLTLHTYSLVKNEGDKKEILVMQWVQTFLAFAPLLVGIVLCGRWLLRKIMSCKQAPPGVEDSLLSWRGRSENYDSMSMDESASHSSH